MARKTLKIKIGSVVWTLREAKLFLTDDTGGAFSDSYNHPLINLRFAREGTDGKNYGDYFSVAFKFQRNLRNLNDTHFVEGSHEVKTRRKWSACYAAKVDLHSADKFTISDRPFALDAQDQARVNLARKVAREIKVKNLWHVHKEDECARVLAALDNMGVTVERLYKPTVEERGEWRDLWSERRKWADEAEAAAEAEARIKARDAS